MTAAKEARQQKLTEKAARAALKVMKKAQRETADAEWKLMMVVHNEAVAAWEVHNLVLRARKVKVKDLPKKPKRPTRPKIVEEVDSDGDKQELVP